MSDFTWLQYIGNPFSVIAVICAILGFSLRIAFTKMDKPKPAFVLTMYGMFLMTVLALGLGGLAITFLLLGNGAKDYIASDPVSINQEWNLFPTAKAEMAVAPLTKKIDKKSIHLPKTGWVWAGETKSIPSLLPQKQQIEQSIVAPNFDFNSIKEIHHTVITTKDTNLRKKPPEYQWFLFQYKLGELTEVLPKGTTLEVINKIEAGKQYWLEVKVKAYPEENNSGEIKTYIEVPVLLEFIKNESQEETIEIQKLINWLENYTQ